MPGLLVRKNVVAALMTSLRRIIESAQQGDLPPWKHSWTTSDQGLPGFFNPTTGKSYRGMNTAIIAFESLLRGLQDPRFMGYQQALKAGWQVRKGARAIEIVHPVLIKIRSTKEQDKNPRESLKDLEGEFETPQDRPSQIVRYKAFHIFSAEDIDGIPSLTPSDPSAQEHAQTEGAQRILAIAQKMQVTLYEQGSRPHYRPHQDAIMMPARDSFTVPGAYEGVLLHEIAHATGHKDRLDRVFGATFGDLPYAHEEVIAETASWLMSLSLRLPCVLSNPEDQTQEANTEAYIGNWAQRVLTLDPDTGWDRLEQAMSAALRVQSYLDQHHTCALQEGLVPPLSEAILSPITEEDTEEESPRP